MIDLESALGNSAGHLAEQHLSGKYALAKTLWDLQLLSKIEIRASIAPFGVGGFLQGTWTYTPRRLDGAVNNIGYSLARVSTAPVKTTDAPELMARMQEEAERVFVHDVARELKKKLMVSGSLRLPASWHIRGVTANNASRIFHELLAAGVDEQHPKIRLDAEKSVSWLATSPPGQSMVLMVSSTGYRWYVEGDPVYQDLGIDMTNILPLAVTGSIANLTDDELRAYAPFCLVK